MVHAQSIDGERGTRIDPKDTPAIITCMLRDVIPYDEFSRILKKESPTNRARASFVNFIEERLGGTFMYDAARFPFQRPDLADLFQLADKMRKAGVIQSYGPWYSPHDEPPYQEWRAIYRDGEDSAAAGTTVDDDRGALSAALAEASERHMWFETTDYFQDERLATTSEMQAAVPTIAPGEYASFTDEQRATHPHLALRDVPYIWIRGESLIDGSFVHLPAQVMTGASRLRERRHVRIEPTILQPITNGLATWPTQEGARLRGLLEVIERDAYSITWLNQITPSRFNTDALAAERETLGTIVEKSRRYRLEPHFLRLITDAPTYVVMTILEDLSGHAPRFSFGIKASSNAARAAEGAVFEALRGRRGARYFIDAGIEIPKREHVGHIDRVLYWAEAARAEHLAFLIAGQTTAPTEAWHNEADDVHYARLIAWLRARGYRAVSIPYTHSKKNVTPWHIEFVNVPSMQPIYFNESEPHIGGARLTDVPRLFGFTPRAKPFTDHPHPFS